MVYTKTFLDESKEIIDRIDVEAVEAMADTVAEIRAKGGRLFFIGSGGGAGHASHAVCDFRKIAGIESYAVTDNVSELTARINDDGWDTSYANWLKVSKIGENDGVFVFSVGGGNAEKNVSTNLVKAMQLAQEKGAKVLGVVGRDGGYTKQVGDAVCLVTCTRGDVTAQTEAFQALVWHLLISHPKVQQNAMKWESIS